MTETITKPKIIAALEGQPQDPPPIWLMRQAGRYLPEYRKLRAEAGSFLNLCLNPSLACEAAMQPIRRFNLDGAILFSDILLVPMALGSSLHFEEGEGPRLSPTNNSKTLTKLSMKHFRETLSPIYETTARMASSLPPESTLIGFAGAPWTLATYMVAGRGSRDQREALLWAWRNETSFTRLIDLLTEATILHLSDQIRAGAKVVQIFDSWASALTPSLFTRYCIKPTAKIVASLKRDHPETKIIGFPNGAGEKCRDYATKTGIDALSLDKTCSLTRAREALSPICALQGNLDPILLCAGGKALKREARNLVETMKGKPYIFNLGHGILPETDPKSVNILINTIRNHGENS